MDIRTYFVIIMKKNVGVAGKRSCNRSYVKDIGRHVFTTKYIITSFIIDENRVIDEYCRLASQRGDLLWCH